MKRKESDREKHKDLDENIRLLQSIQNQISTLVQRVESLVQQIEILSDYTCNKTRKEYGEKKSFSDFAFGKNNKYSNLMDSIMCMKLNTCENSKKENEKEKISDEEDTCFRNFLKRCDIYEDSDRRKVGYKVYKDLHDKNTDETNVFELLNILKNEINNQYMRRNEMYTRSGILLGFWSVLITQFIENQMDINIALYHHMFLRYLGGLFAISVLIIFLSAIQGMRTRKYSEIGLKNFELFIDTAVNDKAASVVQLLNVFFKSYENNKKVVSTVIFWNNVLIITVVFNTFIIFIILWFS